MTTDRLTLSADQSKAHDSIIEFWEKGKQLLTLGGYAGTGKTTLLGETVRTLRKRKKGCSIADARIAFCCYTGKASDVLRSKLKDSGVYSESDYCGTIHGLMYRPLFGSNGKIIGWKPHDTLPYDLIVVDEASMVGERLYDDLKQYKIPILAVGDHGQLPPIKGNFNLMEDPMIRLEKIHRQAEDNPVIKLSMMARLEGYIPVGVYSYDKQYVKKVRDINILQHEANPENMLVLCGVNWFRTKKNQEIRKRAGMVFETPQPGDRVICLRNNKEAGIYNGMLGTLEEMEEDTETTYGAIIQMDNGVLYDGRIYQEQFSRAKTMDVRLNKDNPIDLFDFGYCLTVHKAQGSEHPRVVVFEQRTQYMDDDMWRRWSYTAVTRSSKNLIVVGI